MFGYLQHHLKTIDKRLQHVATLNPTEETYGEMWQLKNDLAEVDLRNEIMWKQRSILECLNEGDNNPRYFHSYASTRRRTNRITRLKLENGDWTETEEQIEGVGSWYFTQLFTSLNPPADEPISAFIPCKLSDNAIRNLQSPYTSVKSLEL